jgi:hypothetical protein
MSRIDPTIPENGWLVVCMALGRYVIAMPSFDALARTVGAVIDERARDTRGGDYPIQVFELGRQMDVGLDYKVAKLEPIPRPAPYPVDGSDPTDEGDPG